MRWDIAIGLSLGAIIAEIIVNGSRFADWDIKTIAMIFLASAWTSWVMSQ